MAVPVLFVQCGYCGARFGQKCTRARSRTHDGAEVDAPHGERVALADRTETCDCEFRDRAWNPLTHRCESCRRLYVDERERAAG